MYISSLSLSLSLSLSHFVSIRHLLQCLPKLKLVKTAPVCDENSLSYSFALFILDLFITFSIFTKFNLFTCALTTVRV